MYIRITTRCQLRCPHCCFSCGPRGVKRHGIDMDRGTFIAACELASNMEESIDLGGGEPLVHPLFFDFIGIALRYFPTQGGVWLATNGVKAKDALQLAQLAKNGIIAARLSVDEFHGQIDPDVIEAFKRPMGSLGDNKNDYRATATSTVTSIIAAGRGKKIVGAKKGCCCAGPIVNPDGKIWGCGCFARQFGTVYNPKMDGMNYNDCNA